ncbi:MAG: hypothetical protein DRI34_07390 [Deltaproteobacteria bacterium]|nr:MAG: hypothetical protein DRI34_07390 [Deltaproteobacteria bacterium]
MHLPGKNRLRLMGLALGIILGLVMVVLQLAGVFERWEVVSLDARFRLRGPRPLDRRISVVLVDEPTLEALGWPLPRATWAALVDIARRHGARTLGFDILFADPGRHPEQDQALAQAAADSGVVVFPAQLGFGARAGAPPAGYLDECPRQGDSAGSVPRATGMVGPLGQLAAAGAGAAHLQLDGRPDGVFRKVPLFLGCQGRLVPTLALRLVSVYRDRRLGKPGFSGRRLQMPSLGMTVPLARRGGAQVYVNFQTVTEGIRAASLVEILRAQHQLEQGGKPELEVDEFFRDKLVLVGQMAASVGDHGPTPLSADSPLVLVHANLADNLIRGSFLTRVPAAVDALVLVGLCLVLSVLLVWLRTRYAVGAVSLVAIAFAALNYWLFAGRQVWLELVTPLVTTVVATLLLSTYNHLVRDARERLVKSAFERYVAPGMLERILERAADLSLNGEYKRLTILFSDIKGYTSLSNRLEPDRVLQLLREYLQVMTEVLHHHGGWVDKIMGDGIMAVFGDPLPAEDHARRAVEAALEMQRQQKRLQQSWRAEGKSGLEMRIGIATGDVYVGNIGSSHHLEYTALGRAVNLAARLEAAAPPGDILISHETREELGDGYSTILVEGLELKGFDDVSSAWLIEGQLQKLTGRRQE